MKKRHSLLSRQLAKYCNGSSLQIPPEWEGLLNAVDAAYRANDMDRAMLERSLELSSQELLKANAEQRAVFQTIPDLLFRFDAEGKILDCKADIILDQCDSSGAMVGKYILDVLPDHIGMQYLEAISQVRQTQTMVSFEYSLTARDEDCFYEARFLPLVENQSIALIRNISNRKFAEYALKESEEKYRTLIENINVGIYRSNPDFRGHFLQANPAMIKLFGYTSLEEFLSVSIVDFYQELDDRRVFLQEVIETGFVKDKDLRMKKRDGTPIVVSCTGRIQYDTHGGMKWIDGVMEDITERKMREEELLKTSKLESLGILAGGIAHDFNNILTAIIGNISLARLMAPPESAIYTRLQEAEKGSRRAQDLTQQLLTFSKGGAPIKKVAAIAHLLRDSACFVLSGSNVRCEFSIPDDLPSVEVDEGQICQVINNLVINAHQSMPQGGTIRVKAEPVELGGLAGEQGLPLSDGTYIKITIQDEGKGIPEEHLDKIFDPYFTTKTNGTGLGLTTTYSIMKRHDGHISVKSKPGVGTTFSLYLPVTDKKEVCVKHEQAELPHGQGRVLIMDDEELVREVGGSILRHLGYEVDFARDGHEALELVKNVSQGPGCFDVIIMDLTVPGGMGGKETIRLLREINPTVSVIASSGYSNDPIMAEYEKYGFNAVVPKPYRIEHLKQVLHQLIAGNKHSCN